MTPAEIRIAAETVYGEARGEPWIGKLAVAYVIRNRVEWPAWWGRSVTEVCTKPWQFSCRNPGDPNLTKLNTVTEDDRAFLDCIEAVGVAFAGAEPDPTNGATTYKVIGTKASWDAAVGRTEPIIIGRHAFWCLTPEGAVIALVAAENEPRKTTVSTR